MSVYVRTEKHRKKMSIMKKSKNNPMRGKKLSMEHREKLSIALKGNKNSLGYKHTKATRNKMSIANKGKKLSDGHISKIATANTKDWGGPCNCPGCHQAGSQPEQA